ncbi:MAG: IS3 family transposase, partial [Aureispira sp.]|nr:IS3 family transposase [Aureispira sp.]
MRAYNNVAALQMAFDMRGMVDFNQQLIHHSDRGSQYISESYTSLLA